MGDSKVVKGFLLAGAIAGMVVLFVSYIFVVGFLALSAISM